MPRPPTALMDALVDADVCARAASTIQRQFSAADLPRLREANAEAVSAIHASFRFSLVDGRPAQVDASLHGSVSMTCQRCMSAVPIRIDEGFRVVVVPEERDDEPGGYEPVVANAARLDLRWLVEEQALLALPLVPMHEGGQCGGRLRPAAADEAGESSAQQPFRNLRDMLRQR